MTNSIVQNLLEIACFSIESCILAQKAGAHRIEFCADYDSGGITPPHREIIEARKLIHIPLYVMIRPRKGNYVYSEDEITVMKNTIQFCKQTQINGIVFGILDSQNEIEELLCKELLELARPMKCTFHRAIDCCKDLHKSIEKLIDLGFDTVLTSGGYSDALTGMDTLKQLQKKFGEKISIMPGGGIRPSNIEFIKSQTGCSVFHSAAMQLNSKTIDEKMISELLHAINS